MQNMEYFYLLYKRWQPYKYIFGELSGNSQSNTVITMVYFLSALNMFTMAIKKFYKFCKVKLEFKTAEIPMLINIEI